jgi:hypothetical protein
MREMMVRKQIYLPRKQNLMLKRLAKQRGVSEAEVLRQALEHEAKEISYQSHADVDGWKKIQQFVKERKATYTGKGKPVDWDRENLYEGRGAPKPGMEK